MTLVAFYHDLVARFPQKEEAFLHSLDPLRLNQVAFRYTLSVSGMIRISHIIEAGAAATPGAADLHVCFQQFSRFEAQQVRYQQVAATARGLWLYGLPDAGIGPLPRTVLVDISGTPLPDYWYVIAYGPGIMMTLLAKEVPSAVEGKRAYEGFYTFDSSIAFQLVEALHHTFPRQVPQPTEPQALR